MGFDPVPELDPLALGVYWGLHANDYPQRSLLPAVSDDAGFRIGPQLPMRAFLVNRDDQFVLQLQADRFFMNWRNRGRGYPRFSERHGTGGLLKRAMDEFKDFETFVQKRFDRPLVARRIELTKIDVLKRGQHWNDLADLAKLLPVTAALDPVKLSDQRQVDFRFAERSESGVRVVQINSVADDFEPKAIRMEFTMSCELRKTPPSEAFEEANEVLNDAFFTLLNENELWRFRSKQGETG